MTQDWIDTGCTWCNFMRRTNPEALCPRHRTKQTASELFMAAVHEAEDAVHEAEDH